MKKILIDATTLSDQFKNRGVGRYSFEVISRMILNNSMQWHLICFDDFINKVFNDKTLEFNAFKSKNVTLHSIGKMFPSSYSNLWKFKKLFSPIIKKVHPNVYFSPQFERGLPQTHKHMKIIAMIHDVIPMETNIYSRKSNLHNFIKGIYYRHQFKKVKHADLILTHTDFSKTQINKYIKIKQDNIKVIYLGIKEEFKHKNIKDINIQQVKSKYKLNRPYILYYGGFEPNKNVESLINAFANYQKNNVNNILVLVTSDIKISQNKFISDDARGNVIAQILNKNNLIDFVKIISTPSDNELAAILCGAKIFMHLSTYEGFGLSVAESLAAGTPTIIANRSCYPELFAHTSLLVNPTKVNKIVDAIIKLDNNSQMRNNLINDGLKFAEELDWDNTAKYTFQNLIA